MAESVKVIVRCRPMNQRENNLNCKACIKCDDTINKVTIFKPDDKSSAPKNFTFDGAYFTQSTTKQIYEDVGFALVDGVLEGYNGTGKNVNLVTIDEHEHCNHGRRGFKELKFVL